MPHNSGNALIHRDRPSRLREEGAACLPLVQGFEREHNSGHVPCLDERINKQIAQQENTLNPLSLDTSDLFLLYT